MAAFQQPTKQPYVMHSLAMPTTSRQERLGDTVNQAFWWEVMCLLKPLPPVHTEAIISLLGDPTLKVQLGPNSHMTTIVEPIPLLAI